MPLMTVTTTPQLVPSGGSRDVRSMRTNTVDIWIDGTESVVAGSSYWLVAGEAYSTAVNDGVPDLWAVVASGTAQLAYIV